jgi:hypothetical protein
MILIFELLIIQDNYILFGSEIKFSSTKYRGFSLIQ